MTRLELEQAIVLLHSHNLSCRCEPDDRRPRLRLALPSGHPTPIFIERKPRAGRWTSYTVGAEYGDLLTYCPPTYELRDAICLAVTLTHQHRRRPITTPANLA